MEFVVVVLSVIDKNRVRARTHKAFRSPP